MAGTSFQTLQAFTKQNNLVEGNDEAMPPILPHQNFEARPYVSHLGVNMKSMVMWHDATSDFYHEETTGEEWVFGYGGKLQVTDFGNWATRTPILHPSVAGIDATEAGYDDAYLRALQQVDVLTFGTRDESKMIVRRMVERYSKIKYSPYRLLVRAVVLWAVASRNEHEDPGVHTAYAATDLPQPMRLSDTGGFSAIARAQYTAPGDVIYIRCDTVSELGTIDVARALTAQQCPVSTNMSVRQLWPALVGPQVVYTSATSAGMGAAAFDADTVEQFIYKFCTQFDCFDLLRVAMQCVQLYLVRPQRAGIWGGSTAVRIGMPPSDLRIGAIGPLLAGISAEGMRTERYLLPDWTDFAYGSAARACFAGAAYFEGLTKFDHAHPVAYTYSSYVKRGRMRMLSDLQASRAMIDAHAIPLLSQAGWECWPEQLRDVAPMHRKNFEAELFNGPAVPWWSNVIGHMAAEGAPLLADWSQPGHLKEFVDPSKWYTYDMLGGATQGQVTSAVRWLGAKITYVLSNGPFSLARCDVTVPTSTRFMAHLRPTVILNGRQKAVACMQFPSTANSGSIFLRAIARCQPAVLKHSAAKDALPAASLAVEMLDGSVPDQVLPISIAGPNEPSGRGDDVFDQPLVPQEAELGAGLRESIDWDDVTKKLKLVGVNTTATVFPAALQMGRETGNGPYTAAMQLGRVTTSHLERLGDGERVGVAQAVLLAGTRLAPHAGGESLNYGDLQAAAMRIVMASVAKRKHAPPALTQAEMDEQASSALTAGVSANGGGVPAAHDDPEPASESLPDFGEGRSGLTSEPGRPTASDVPDLSQTAKIGFLPPETTASLSFTHVTSRDAVRPQSE